MVLCKYALSAKKQMQCASDPVDSGDTVTGVSA